MASVHASAMIGSEVDLADDVEIGPYCVLEGPVRLGPGVRLASHVVLQGPLEIGPGTAVWPFACLGGLPQDYKFGPGADTAGVRIGSNCLIREHVTVHGATSPDEPTTIGDRVFMMVAAHAGHDVHIEDDVVLVNNASLAGHARVGRGATLSGFAMVHQHCRVGRLAFMSGAAGVSTDVPPFCVVNDRQRLGGINLVGMRRAGMDRQEITQVRRVFRDVFRRSLPRQEMQAILDDRGVDWPAIREIAEFVRAARRPICPGRGHPPRLGDARQPAESDSVAWSGNA